MYGDGIKPLKATGTRWIDHRIRAMGRFVDKFGLYMRHLTEFIDETQKSSDRAVVQGKLNKLVDAQVLLRSAFLKDLLNPAKIFSLITQKDQPNIIEIVDAVEKTRRDYKKLLTKFQRDQNSVFELPLLKAVITEVEGNDEDGDRIYQDQKQYMKILKCYDERYWSETSVGEDARVVMTSDHLVLDVCKVLIFFFRPIHPSVTFWLSVNFFENLPFGPTVGSFEFMYHFDAGLCAKEIKRKCLFLFSGTMAHLLFLFFFPLSIF